MKATDFSHERPRFPCFEFINTGGFSGGDGRRICPRNEGPWPSTLMMYDSENDNPGSYSNSSIAEEKLRNVSIEDFRQSYSSRNASLVAWNTAIDISRLQRSRSLIRTNPWVGSIVGGGGGCGGGSGRNEAQTEENSLQFRRSWSTPFETREPSSSSSWTVRRGSCATPADFDPLSYSFGKYRHRCRRRDDSLMATSVESDSLYHSLGTSDTDVSVRSVSDIGTPTNDEWLCDTTSGYVSIIKQNSFRPEGRAEHPPSNHRPMSNFDFTMDDGGKSKDKRSAPWRSTCQSTTEGLGERTPVDQSRIMASTGKTSQREQHGLPADEYDVKTTTWLNSQSVNEEAMTRRWPSYLPSRPTFGELGVRETKQSTAGLLQNRNLACIDRKIWKENHKDFDVTSYESSSSFCSLDFRKRILDIRSSLQDKVAKLRSEKKVVDDKIREAREEERLRLQQLENFRKQLSQTRREILLRTIEEMKRSLNEQSMKLQKLYDIILVEERQILCR